MARTVKIAKSIRVPGPGEFLRPPLRRVPPKPPTLYLLQLRARFQSQMAPRPLTISVTTPGNPDARPEPVKIIHS